MLCGTSVLQSLRFSKYCKLLALGLKNERVKILIVRLHSGIVLCGTSALCSLRTQNYVNFLLLLLKIFTVDLTYNYSVVLAL